MWRRQNVQTGATTPSSPPREQFPLCRDCGEWLAKTVATAHQDVQRVENFLVAAPLGLERREAEDRCIFCRATLKPSVSVIGIEGAVTAEGDPVVTNGLCPSCDQWLVSLAIDSRSARGRERRRSEGAYGSVLHPKLQHVRASLAVQNENVEAVLRAACEQLGITVAPTVIETTVDVRFIEANGDGASLKTVMEAHPATKTVILARVEAAAELRDGIRAGASGWVTIPFTPQQIVGALKRITVEFAERVQWDLGTCVPQIRRLETTRPAIVATPDKVDDPFLAAWSLRRFTRGYDDLVMFEGHLLLLPLASPEHIWNIIERLTVVLGERAILLPYEAPTSIRFDASA